MCIRDRLMGLDIEMLIKREFFESVMIGAGHGDNPSLSSDINPLRTLKLSKTKIYAGGSNVNAHGGAWNCSINERARRMKSILDAGIDGGFFWDCNVFANDWHIMKKFGDKQLLDKLIKGQISTLPERKTLKIHDLVVGRYNPWHAY